MLVRNAVVDDVPAILQFGAAVVPEHYGPILGEEAAAEQLAWWTTERISSAALAGRAFVALDGDHVVGVCESGEFDGGYVVWKLYVHPRWRGRSIGRDLLRTAVAARPHGVDQVLLEHFAGNHGAARFYEREGFLEIRSRPAASGDPAAATVWRRRQITEQA